MVEFLPRDATVLVDELIENNSRVLLFGEAGVGKSFLAAQLADACQNTCWLVDCNVGSPTVGPPGCVTGSRRARGGWQAETIEALCTLDAGRFRLPLVLAVSRVLERTPPGPVLLDAPGISRGALAFELLTGLVRTAGVSAVVYVGDNLEAAELAGRAALPARVVAVPPSPRAAATGKLARAELRTALWDRYLEEAATLRLEPPPTLGAPLGDDCAGRQVALLDSSNHTLALAEVEGCSDGVLEVRTPLRDAGAVRALLVRDARRTPSGSLGTAPLSERSPARGRAEIDLQPDTTSDMVATRPEPNEITTAPISAHVASARVVLVNGLLGDPTLHLRFRHQRRSLLFDVGETARLQGRIAHQVSDVFISHGHVDHIGGFLWLLRSRIGILEPCRVFGAPGIGDRVAGMLAAIEWDRVGDRGPVFEVIEVAGDQISAWRLQAGVDGREPLEWLAADGLLLSEPGFTVRTATLDHAGLPVLAFALEESKHLNVRKERLEELALEPGPWLETLKRRFLAGEHHDVIELPNGSRSPAGELAAQLLIERAGEKIVYATDLGDSASNREALVELARGAHTLFCEAAFAAEDQDQARTTGHLTARACAEIATAAGVGQLIPFHLSRRYERDPERVLAEVARGFPGTFIPPSLRAVVAALT